MAKAKYDQFSDEDVDLAKLAHALAHPARVEILRKVAAMQECICGDLVEVLPLSQSTVSQHLKVLKEAGLIRGEIDGPRVCYCLDEHNCLRAGKLINQLFHHIKCC